MVLPHRAPLSLLRGLRHALQPSPCTWTRPLSTKPPIPPRGNRLRHHLESAASMEVEPLGDTQKDFPSEDDSDDKKMRRARAQGSETAVPAPSLLDDSERSVLLFPGQGSEFVGMGVGLAEEIPSVRDLYDRASHLLGYDLLRMCKEGPAEALHSTLYSQPAVVVASLAAVERLYAVNPKAVEECVATAGFSVGEITALIFSGAITFDDGIKLVKVRAEAMQHCSDMEPSGMMSVFFGADHKLGMATEAARRWAKEKHKLELPVCQVANYLYAGGKVLAGHSQCLDFIEENASDFNIRRCRHLPVSGAFHTPLMRPAVPVFKAALAGIEVHQPRVPVHSTVEGKVLTSAARIKETLPSQIVKAVKWEQAMVKLFNYERQDHYPRVYECGPGRAGLSAILKKVKGTAGKKAEFVGV